MKTLAELVTPAEHQSESYFELANLSLKRTGLPFVVWISSRAGALHDVYVKVSVAPIVNSSELVSVAIRPEVRVVSGTMSGYNLALLKKMDRPES